MADQAKDKSDVTVPVVDAPPKEAVSEKSSAPVAEETAPEPDGEAPEAEKPEAGMSEELSQFAHRTRLCLPVAAIRLPRMARSVCPLLNSR